MHCESWTLPNFAWGERAGGVSPAPRGSKAMSDHLADIRKYAKKPVNEAASPGLEKTYRLVLSHADSRFVACSDPKEVETVRENFLKKKLGLAWRRSRRRHQDRVPDDEGRTQQVAPDLLLSARRTFRQARRVRRLTARRRPRPTNAGQAPISFRRLVEVAPAA